MCRWCLSLAWRVLVILSDSLVCLTPLVQALGFSDDEGDKDDADDCNAVQDKASMQRQSPAAGKQSSKQRTAVRLDSAWLVNHVLLPLLRVAMR